MMVASYHATLAIGARDDLDTYTYEKLESSSTIRLLRLYPGTGDDPLHGELDHTELLHDTSWNKIRHIRKKDEYLRCVNAQPENYRNEDIDKAIQFLDRVESPNPDTGSDKQSPTFEAISYVWGVPDFTRAMVSPAGIIWVTPNLEDALRAVRLPDRDRVLWADAICINQLDIEERGRQVKMMGRIYRSAERVLVWLGTDPRGIALHTIRTILSTPFHGDALTDRETSNAVQTLSECEWFSRLWVVQELNCSRQAIFMWGKEHVGLGDILDRLSTHLPNRSFLDWSWIDTCKLEKLQVHSVFHWLRTLRCSDSRDRIYAIRNLPYHDDCALSQEICAIEPDYAKSPTQLYHEVACTLLKHDVQMTLDWVGRSNYVPFHTEGLPLWAPDWGDDIKFHALGEHLPAAYTNAVSLSEVNPMLDYRKRVLTVSGFMTDTAMAVHAAALGPVDIRTSIRHCVDFWNTQVYIMRATMSISDYAQYELTFLRTLICQGEWHEHVMPWEHYLQTFNTTTSERDGRLYADCEPYAKEMMCSLSQNIATLPETLAECDDITRHWDSNSKAWNNRKLFRTVNGHLGLGPAAMTAHDTVAVFSRFKYPAILRSDGDFWTFIGLAFVAAYTKDEVLRMWEAQNCSVQHFHLR